MEFKIDLKGHDEIKRSLDILGKKSGTVVARSINKVATSMRTGGIKAIKEEYTVKTSEIRNVMWINKANRNRLFAVINTVGTRLRLRKAYETFQFALAKNRKRVMVQVLKKGSPKILRHAFYATMESGHKGIYERMGRPRLPIRELYGPSLPQIVRAVRIRKVWEKIYNEKMLPTLSHEIEAELKGYTRSYGE